MRERALWKNKRSYRLSRRQRAAAASAAANAIVACAALWGVGCTVIVCYYSLSIKNHPVLGGSEMLRCVVPRANNSDHPIGLLLRMLLRRFVCASCSR